jgi:hypothetical protein
MPARLVSTIAPRPTVHNRKRGVEMKNNFLFKAAFVLSVLFGSVSVFAASGTGSGSGAGNVAQVFPNVQDPCQYPVLVLDLMGMKGTDPKNWNDQSEKECIDVPVALNTMQVVFNIDTDSRDGNGNSIGLKHMVFLARAIKDRIDNAGVDPTKVQIVGVLHGSGAGWAIKSDAPDGGAASDSDWQQKKWIEALWDLKDEGVNVQLEICGVTMYGHNLVWTKKNLYGYDASGNPIDPNHRILVNQGAIGRIIDLEQHGFVLINEGFEGNPSKHDNPSNPSPAI